LRLFVEMLEKDSRRSEFPLVVTHVTRNDIILGFLAHAQKLKQDGQPFGGALVCTTNSVLLHKFTKLSYLERIHYNSE
jgi:hypothetical protein